MTGHLVAEVDGHVAGGASPDHTTMANAIERLGLRTFVVPITIPDLDVGIAWDPRNDADSAHLWFRRRLAEAFLSALHP